MNVFLAGEGSGLIHQDVWGLRFRKFLSHRLFSYYYHGMKTGRVDADITATHEAGADLFLDSGAFSAYTRGEEIDLERYAKFINEQGHFFSVKANLDVIGDTGPKSWENMKALESLGADVFPVFHYSDDEVYLKKILEEGYEFFALGGLVGASRNKLQSWLDRIWKKYLLDSKGRPIRKVHGFGLTDQVLMLRYPWFSVDSASWIFSGSFGSCMFVLGDSLKKVDFSDDSPSQRRLNSWHYKSLTEPEQKEVASWLGPTECTVEDCQKEYLARFVVNAKAYQDMGKLATGMWEQVSQEEFF